MMMMIYFLLLEGAKCMARSMRWTKTKYKNSSKNMFTVPHLKRNAKSLKTFYCKWTVIVGLTKAVNCINRLLI